MFEQKRHILLACIVAAGLPAAAAAQLLAPLPYAPAFPAPGHLQIDVTNFAAASIPAGCGTSVSPAVGDGITDDGCEFQAALDDVAANGGGVVFVPEGTYLIDRTLTVDDDTWVVGAGDNTKLERGPTQFPYDSFQVDPANPGACGSPVPQLSHRLFTNSSYNCGNTGIVLTNFAIDGNRVPTPTGNGSAITIAFCGVSDTHIWNLNIADVPQDAILLRNGGVGTSVMNTVIEGFNMKSSQNGAAIRISMLDDGNIGDGVNPEVDARPPVTLSGNTVISQTTQGGNVVHGISFNRPVPLAGLPHALIQNNSIQVTNGQTGVSCFDCVDSTIVGNKITPTLNVGDQRFSGVVVTGQGFRILKNEVVGAGAAVTHDGRGILVGPTKRLDVDPVDVTVMDNVIRNKNIFNAQFNLPLAALEIRGISNFLVKNNVVENISSSPGIVIGHCSVGNIPTPTAQGVVASNDVSTASNSPLGYSILRTSDVWLLNNLDQGLPLSIFNNFCQLEPPSFCPDLRVRLS